MQPVIYHLLFEEPLGKNVETSMTYVFKMLPSFIAKVKAVKASKLPVLREAINKGPHVLNECFSGERTADMNVEDLNKRVAWFGSLFNFIFQFTAINSLFQQQLEGISKGIDALDQEWNDKKQNGELSNEELQLEPTSENTAIQTALGSATFTKLVLSIKQIIGGSHPLIRGDARRTSFMKIVSDVQKAEDVIPENHADLIGRQIGNLTSDEFSDLLTQIQPIITRMNQLKQVIGSTSLEDVKGLLTNQLNG